MDAIPSIDAIIILDAIDGSRVHSKHFSPSLKQFDQQIMFEKRLYSKTKSASSKKTTSSDFEVLMLDQPSTVCVYRQTSDTIFYCVGNSKENELILLTVLKGLYESLNSILRQNLTKKNLLMSLDVVLLAVDEVVDGGLILETDPQLIAQRVLMKDSDGGEAASNVALGEMTVAQALETARKQFAKNWAF